MDILIKELNDEKLVIITAILDFNPIKKLKLISAELEERKFQGTVTFDLLVLNGIEDNRFISMYFDGKKFDKSTICIQSHIKTNLEIEQNSFFKNNIDLLAHSVLSSKEISYFA
ncbi:type II toxin-antitoxin system RnlB family antitoxin [Acinetobacter bouvetii]|uniref:Antitoxin LsoB n=1 Tax=Acinetobacter bouvetii TaxID=202951 RepID=A0A811GLE4_9GAMM|nr:type II toxin-antitoxin system RnlB family antitoxin [Acinetobacter bouvetii]CAB1220853.1 Antitoxin LsoB [Acinetobacter bouvetii]